LAQAILAQVAWVWDSQRAGQLGEAARGMDCHCARFALLSALEETDHAVATVGSRGSRSAETATPSSNCTRRGLSRDADVSSHDADIGKDSGCGPTAARVADRLLSGRAYAGELRRRRYALSGDAGYVLPSRDADCFGRRGAPSGAPTAGPCRPLTPLQERCPSPGAPGAPRAAEQPELRELRAGGAMFEGADLAGRGARAASTAEALVEGPMQQRFMWFLWRWRWCLLTRQELRIYADRRASIIHPDRPLERYSAGALDVTQDLHCHSTLVCMDAVSGEPLLLLRPGPHAHLEELVASRLWQHAFSAARMRYRSGQRGPQG